MYGRQHGEALRGGGRDFYGDAPRGCAASLVNEGILSRAKVIDLSADFRIKAR